jgi:hypothetical protein
VERLLEQLEGQRGDQRAAGEGEQDARDGPGDVEARADRRADHQGAGRGEAVEEAP